MKADAVQWPHKTAQQFYELSFGLHNPLWIRKMKQNNTQVVIHRWSLSS